MPQAVIVLFMRDIVTGVYLSVQTYKSQSIQSRVND